MKAMIVGPRAVLADDPNGSVLDPADLQTGRGKKPQDNNLTLARRQELHRADDRVAADDRFGVIRDRADGVVVVIERPFGHASRQETVAIAQQVDQDAVRVGVRRIAGLLPASGGSDKRDLEQVFRVRSIAGQEIGAAKRAR